MLQISSEGGYFIKISDVLGCETCQRRVCEEVEDDKGELTGVRVPRWVDLPCVRFLKASKQEDKPSANG